LQHNKSLEPRSKAGAVVFDPCCGAGGMFMMHLLSKAIA
jgi:type I restriction-modification system DNA methylase subunit